MKNIYQNPYRIIGILSNATAREIQARKGKIQAFTRVGKPVDSEYDFSFLEDITRDDTTITKAFSDIEQNIDKVKHSLFWFINHSSFDQMALEHLKNGDTSKAKEIWHKLTNGQEINARNFSAFHNLSTCLLITNPNTSKKVIVEYNDLNFYPKALNPEAEMKINSGLKYLLDGFKKQHGRNMTPREFINYLARTLDTSKLANFFEYMVAQYEMITEEKFSNKEGLYFDLIRPKINTIKENVLSSTIIQSIQYKIKLIESDYFTDFVHLVADETYNIDKNKQIEIFIDELLKENISPSQVPLLLKQLGGYAKTYLTQKATEGPIYSIETAVESCEEKRRKDKNNTYKYAKELYTNTQKPLAELKNILGIQDLKYQAVADSIAKELKQCAIDNWNNSNEEETDLKKSIELATLASKIAVGKNLKEDIQKDIKTLSNLENNLKNSKYNDCFQLIAFLKEIENKYKNQGVQTVYDDDPITGLPRRIPRFVDNVFVDRDKVKSLLKEILTDNIIRKISSSNNDELISKYLDVTEYLFDKYDKSSFIHSRINLFLESLPFDSKYKNRVTQYKDKDKYKPNVWDMLLDIHGNILDSIHKHTGPFAPIFSLIYGIFLMYLGIIIIGIILSIFSK